jgi:hypothetical protein
MLQSLLVATGNDHSHQYVLAANRYVAPGTDCMRSGVCAIRLAVDRTILSATSSKDEL